MKKRMIHLSAFLTSGLLMVSAPLVSAASVGDTDASGTVNALDAANVLIKAAEIGAGNLPVSEDIMLMDVNSDNQINAADASAMLVYAARAGASEDIPNFTEYIAQRNASPEYDGAQYVSMIYDFIYRAFTGEFSTSAHTTFLITSPAELEAFVTTMLEIDESYSTRRSTDGKNESAVPLTDTVAKYDAAWFTEHDLIMVIAVEPATRYSHNVRGITENEDGSWTVAIDRLIPAISEQSIPSFAIFVETNKAVEFASSVNVEMTDVYPENNYQS